MMISWKLFRDPSKTLLLDEGCLPLEMMDACVRDDKAAEDVEAAAAAGRTNWTCHGLDLVPTLTQELVQLVRKEGSDEQHADSYSYEFPINRADMALPPVSTGESGLPNELPMLCSLSLTRGAELPTASSLPWLARKVMRATEYRVRGNAAFQKQKLQLAIRMYKQVKRVLQCIHLALDTDGSPAALKALAWTECPSDCEYSQQELQTVAPEALASHTNLATCYWKLNQVDPCIDHCTQALGFEPKQVKALYRRSQAYVSAKAFDEAIADLTAVVSMEPENRLFRASSRSGGAAVVLQWLTDRCWLQNRPWTKPSEPRLCS